MKNLLVTSGLVLALASTAALAQGAFVGGEGDYSFNSKIKTKNIAKSEKITSTKVTTDSAFMAVMILIVIERMAATTTTLRLEKMLASQTQNGASTSF